MLKKHGFITAGILGLCMATANAVDLNTDALKKMQEEGDKIIEQEKGMRMLRMANGNCLTAGGKPGQPGASVVAQKVLQNCAGNPQQKWALDKQKRIAGRAGLCLQANGGNVVAAACSGANNQKWQ